MKNRSKIGNRKGNPAYRTPSWFRVYKGVAKNILKNRKYGNKKYKDS